MYATTLNHSNQDIESYLSDLQFPSLTQEKVTSMDADITEDDIHEAVACGQQVRHPVRIAFPWMFTAET